MRRFFRVKITPPTLHNGEGKRAAERNLERHAKDGPDQRKIFTNYWTRPDVRGLLYATFGQACGYCGANVAETGIVIDHYRPQQAVAKDEHHGGYWWLAYEFENYILSCGICNSGSYKGTQFPLLGGTRLTYETKDELATEVRALLHPCEDDIDRVLCVDIDKAILPVCKCKKVELDEHLAARADIFLAIFENFEKLFLLEWSQDCL